MTEAIHRFFTDRMSIKTFGTAFEKEKVHL